MMDEKIQDAVEKLRQEMRRGTIVLAVMSCLRQPQYGYALLSELNEGGLEVGQDTLYPLLRRLEEQGLLQSEWRVEDPRPRRYYQLNPDGEQVLVQLSAEWKKINQVLRRLTNETE